MHAFITLLILLLFTSCGSTEIDPVVEPARNNTQNNDEPESKNNVVANIGSEAVVPLEVIGMPPFSAEVHVTFDQIPESAVLDLTLQNIVADGAMFLSINSGPPLDLADPAFGFRTDNGSTREGTIALPSGTLKTDNVFTFSYEEQVKDTSGFRVLDFRVGDGSTFVELEPAVPSYDVESPDLENGRHLFVDIALDDGPTCATCHVDSGVDLKYFGFSAQSIAARAMLHEVPEKDALDIAGYIHSLDSDVVGTPFDPPFQPGPENELSRGAGFRSALPSDDAFGELVFGSGYGTFAWDYSEQFDLYRLPIPIELPNWFRWLPRKIDEQWFLMRDGALQIALDDFRARPTDETAQSFMNEAVETGKQLLSTAEDHDGRIELLRFAAVKLWEHSRARGFDAEDYGFASLGPHYPYEIGFAFFEATQDGIIGSRGWHETRRWWWAQLAVNAGRQQSTLERPLNYADVLDAFDRDGAGPNEMLYLFLKGSYEDSFGARGDLFGTGEGLERLLPLAVPAIPDEALGAVWLRHFEYEATQTQREFDPAYFAQLEHAWSLTCDRMTETDRDALQSATEISQSIISVCP